MRRVPARKYVNDGVKLVFNEATDANESGGGWVPRENDVEDLFV